MSLPLGHVAFVMRDISSSELVWRYGRWEEQALDQRQEGRKEEDRRPLHQEGVVRREDAVSVLRICVFRHQGSDFFEAHLR